MYFVVFWQEWCSTIPSCWLFLESKTFKWPPKCKNPTHESIKATLPKENWNTIPYTKLLGPYATYNEAREVEIQAVDISTNDEDGFQALEIKKVPDESRLVKRVVNKPPRFCSSSDNEEHVKKERFLNSQRNSVSQNKDESDEDEESEEAEKMQKSHNIQSFQKPPTHYLKIKKVTNEVGMYNEKNLDVSKEFNDIEESSLKKGSGSPSLESGDFSTLDYGDFFSQDSLLVIEKPKLANNVESNNETHDTSQQNNDRDSVREIRVLKSKPLVRNVIKTNLSLSPAINRSQILGVCLDKNNATHLQNHEQQNERRMHERGHHELCCVQCRSDIQAIKKAVNSIYLLVLDMSNEGPRDATNNLFLKLPITTEEELKDFEILLKEDIARSQYKKLIKNIGGTTFEKHVRNALNATLTDQMVYKISWTGHKKTIMAKEMKFMDLITDTIINSRTDAKIDKIQAVIKSWLQHAGDRLPKGGTKKK